MHKLNGQMLLGYFISLCAVIGPIIAAAPDWAWFKTTAGVSALMVAIGGWTYASGSYSWLQKPFNKPEDKKEE